MSNAMTYLDYSELAQKCLKELISGAKEVRFEAYGPSDDPAVSPSPNVIYVLLSYKDDEAPGGLPALFQRKFKKVFLDSETGKLIAIKPGLAG